MSFLCNLRDRLRRMRIIPKLIVGYVLLICIPLSMFGFLFYKQMYGNMMEQYRMGKTNMMERAYQNLEIELTKLEALYPLFQNNTRLTAYLGGLGDTESDDFYDYKKDIAPTFSYAFINQHLEKVSVYKNDSKIAIITPEIENRTNFRAPAQPDTMQLLSPSKGLWVYEAPSAPDQLPTIRYLHNMYNDSYTRELGVLQLSLSDSLIKQFFQTLQSEDGVLRAVLAQDHSLLFQSSTSRLVLNEASITEALPDGGIKSFYKQGQLVSVVVVDRLGLTLIDIYEIDTVLNIRQEIGLSITIGLLLLGLLSVLYFMIASSITTRIIRFSRYLKRVEDPKMAYYPAESGADEIGFLITSYNAMIVRLDEMVHIVTQTELLKKEAELKMLQAQINPHFIYNTLETMRMLAIVKGDDTVAEIGFKLGKLLRYSLSRGKDETTLAEELAHVQHYIDIHLTRIGDRLSADIWADNEVIELLCPRFILQPLVENSIMHGIEKIRGKGRLTLELRDEGDAVVVKLADNGAGITPDRLLFIREVLAGRTPAEKASFSGGIGLHNVNERIKAYFGGNSGIDIRNSDEGGVLTTIRLEKRGIRLA